MIARRSGKIVNVGGTFGMRGRAGRMAYSASKWGLRGITKSFALEVGPHNINVNCVAPGMVNGERFRGKVVPRPWRLEARASRPTRRSRSGTRAITRSEAHHARRGRREGVPVPRQRCVAADHRHRPSGRWRLGDRCDGMAGTMPPADLVIHGGTRRVAGQPSIRRECRDPGRSASLAIGLRRRRCRRRARRSTRPGFTSCRARSTSMSISATPAIPHKEDWATGTAAAAFGGVTTVFDMPNTVPPTADSRRDSGRQASRCGLRQGAMSITASTALLGADSDRRAFRELDGRRGDRVQALHGQHVRPRSRRPTTGATLELLRGRGADRQSAYRFTPKTNYDHGPA